MRMFKITSGAFMVIIPGNLNEFVIHHPFIFSIMIRLGILNRVIIYNERLQAWEIHTCVGKPIVCHLGFLPEIDSIGSFEQQNLNF